ncbi:MAG: outer membrane protein assembly factor BamD [Rickettsiales bacterium]|jgi:outer membrane protein assembly factor BamD|nr:outer membrane protein assembly factor BamD [Rickettsiales bacterium]
MKSKINTYSVYKFATSIAIFSTIILGISSCTTDADFSKLSADEAYNYAEKQFEKENYVSAAEAYLSIDKNYPYSTLATTSLLKGAFAYYKDNKFTDALDMIYKFLTIAPNSPESPYAHYLQTLCYLEQLDDYRRDQSATIDALKSIEYMQKNYPDSVYIKELTPHIQILQNQLAAKILQTGKEELRINNFTAAINNFQSVISKYPKSDIVPEVLYRLIEVYTSMQLSEIRTKIYERMQNDFSENVWTTRAKNLIEKYSISDATPDSQSLQN